MCLKISGNVALCDEERTIKSERKPQFHGGKLKNVNQVKTK